MLLKMLFVCNQVTTNNSVKNTMQQQGKAKATNITKQTHVQPTTMSGRNLIEGRNSNFAVL
jgi:hypothetical protein